MAERISRELAGRRVAIAGGGIAGLTAALALARRGAEVTLHEQAPSLREFGAGLQISPNGMAVLRALGLEAPVLATGCRAAGVSLHDGLTDRPVIALSFGDKDPPYAFVHRPALLAALAEGAGRAGVALRTGARVMMGAEPAADPVTAARIVESGAAAPLDCDLLLGADGIHSVLRPAVNGPAAPVFAGQVAWRAVIPAEPGEAPLATVAMAPGRHLVSYPLGGGLRNIVAVEERPAWPEARWNRPDDPANLRAAFAGFAPRFRDWLSRVEEVHLWGFFRLPVAQTWHRGRAAILGDAAHPTLPFLAQGANMALEDAWLLADGLAARPDAQGAALAAWQALRLPRTRKIVAAADANARNYHLGGPIRPLAHLALRIGGRIAPGAALSRYDWIYGHDVTAPR